MSHTISVSEIDHILLRNIFFFLRCPLAVVPQLSDVQSVIIDKQLYSK